MTVGVLDHLTNPSVDEVVELALTAEAAGADWVAVSDCFWWRDVWMLLGAAAAATEHVVLGPGVTNPYLQHPFQTVASLATLQELAGPERVFLGIGAGGSATTGVAGISRVDAPERVASLVELVRSVASGGPLDPDTDRSLDLPLTPVPVLIAGRGDRMLRVAGRHADRALVWRVPLSDLDRTIGVIRSGAEGRLDGGPEIVWVPLVAWDEQIREVLRSAAVYAALENPVEVTRGWGLERDEIARIRGVVFRDGIVAAADLVPEAVIADLVIDDPDPAAVADIGRVAGVSSVSIRNFETAALPQGIAWAHEVNRLLQA